MLEQWNNGLWEGGAMRLFANFFLKTKVRNEIILFKNQYSNIPPFHYPIWPTWNMFHIKILLFQQVIEIPIHQLLSSNKDGQSSSDKL